MATEAKNNVCTICDKVGLKPFTKENIFYYYIPLHGVVTYGAQAINIMNPSLAFKVIPKRDMTNVLMLSTVLGAAFYLYGRPHLRTIPNGKRGLYAMLGGTLFSMGSVLTWAFLKSALPKDNGVLASIVGLASGAALIKLSTDYINDCDKMVTKN